MILDNKATRLAPPGWEIWQSKKKWQAMLAGAQPESLNAWGPLRNSAEDALLDAKRLSSGDKE